MTHTVRPEWATEALRIANEYAQDGAIIPLRDEIVRLLSDAERAATERERKMFLDLLTTLTREPWQNEWDEPELQAVKTGYNEALRDIRKLLTNPDLTHKDI